MLVAGPVAVEDWAKRGLELLPAFSQDATYTEPRA
jgi:hypothetical protein